MPHTSHRAFFCRDRFFLSLDARLFVMLPLAQLRQNASLFTKFLETTNGAFDGFVFANSNTGHKIDSPPITAGSCQLLILAEFLVKSSNYTKESKFKQPCEIIALHSAADFSHVTISSTKVCQTLGIIGHDSLNSQRPKLLDLK